MEESLTHTPLGEGLYRKGEKKRSNWKEVGGPQWLDNEGVFLEPEILTNGVTENYKDRKH